MKLSQEEFKALQKHWYDHLADTGFKDVERLCDGELVLCQTPSFWSISQLSDESDQNNLALHLINLKADYFRLMAQMCHDELTVFRNEIDRHVLSRHVEGTKIKTIVEELKDLGTPRDRYSVRIIIRRYEMKWGFKYYTPTQLHIQRRL